MNKLSQHEIMNLLVQLSVMLMVGRLFAEMARFNYGSTVICLWTKEAVHLNEFATETPTVLGQVLGQVCVGSAPPTV